MADYLSMTTTKKIWLGFGTSVVLLGLMIVFIWSLLNSLQTQVAPDGNDIVSTLRTVFFFVVISLAVGLLIGVMVVFRDITERRQAERLLDEQSSLLRLGAEVGTTLTTEMGDLRTMLQSVSESMVCNLDAAFARIWTLNEADNMLELQASAGLYTHIDGGHARIPVGQFKIGLIAHERRPHLTNSVVGDDRVPEQEWAKREGMVAFAGYPLLVEDQVVGVMGMFARHHLNDVTLEAMASVAKQIALSIQNWRSTESERNALTAVRDSRETLRITLNSIGDAVISTNTEGKVTYLNAVAESLTGWTNEDAVGKPLTQVFVVVNETTRSEVENPALRALREGTIVGLAIHTILIAKDGAERPIDNSAAPIRSHEGGIVGSVLIFRDVTDRRRLERERERFIKLAETSSDFIGMCDREGTSFFLNRAAMEIVGLKTLGQALRTPITEFFFPEDQSFILNEFLPKVMQEGKAEVEIRFRHFETGEAVWMLYAVFVLKDDLDQPIGLATVSRNTTERKRSEVERERLLKEVESERERLIEVFQRAPSFMCVLSGPDHVFERANDRYYQLVGHREMVGKTVREALPEVEGQGFFELLDGVFRTGEPYAGSDVPVLLQRQPEDTPEERYIDFVYQAVRSPDGAVTGVLVQGVDLTDRKRAETELRRSEEKRRLALDAAELGAWNIEPATNNLVTDERFRFIFHACTEPITYEEAFAAIHPDDRQRIHDSVAASTRVDGPAPFAEEYRVIHPDGKQRWVFGKGRANFDATEAGRKLVSFDGTVLDITERKQTQDALREQEQRFRTLVEQVEDYAIFVTDAEGRATSWNEGVLRVLGFTEDEFIGTDIVPSIFRPEDVENGVAQAELDEAATTGTANNDRWMVRRDGTHFWAAGVTTGLHDENGKLLGFLKVMRDQTQRKQMEDELRQLAANLSESDRRKTEFLATLGHELRNPLAPIRTGLEAMKLLENDPEAMIEIRNTMERQVQQMVRLIDDLLDISRITQSKMELRVCRVALSNVIQSAVEATKPFIDEAGHQLAVNLPSQPIFLNADPNRLAQVISNLLNNSAKYTPGSGHISLTVEREGSEVVVTIKDNGLGIPADMLDGIFELFRQIDRPLEKGYSGLGIGLSLVKRLVEMHNGSIEVRSDGPNQGSEFSVRLPILIESPTAEFVQEEPAAKSEPLRILVVDDNKAAATMLKMVVKMLGNEVLAAHDGQEAIQVAAEFLPDVVLMDLGMPLMNGYEAARYIRKQSWGQDMLLVALTGWGQDEDRERTKVAGFDHHLVKPAEPAALQQLLANYQPKRV